MCNNVLRITYHIKKSGVSEQIDNEQCNVGEPFTFPKNSLSKNT